MITPKNLIKHELIGLKAKVSKSTNKSQEGLEGEVVDETKKTITINGKIIQKKGSIIMFTLPDKKKVKVRGELLIARPEDRLKKKIKKW